MEALFFPGSKMPQHEEMKYEFFPIIPPRVKMLKTIQELRDEAYTVNLCRTIMRAVRRADMLGNGFCCVHGGIPITLKNDLREIGCKIIWRPHGYEGKNAQTIIHWSPGELKSEYDAR